MSEASELLENARDKIDEALESESSGNKSGFKSAHECAEAAEVLVRQARQVLKADLIEK